MFLIASIRFLASIFPPSPIICEHFSFVFLYVILLHVKRPRCLKRILVCRCLSSVITMGKCRNGLMCTVCNVAWPAWVGPLGGPDSGAAQTTLSPALFARSAAGGVCVSVCPCAHVSVRLCVIRRHLWPDRLNSIRLRGA